jgi:hypothetical protein
LLLFALSASFIGPGAGAQTTGKALQKYPPAALQRDFSLLRETLEKSIPAFIAIKART